MTVRWLLDRLPTVVPVDVGRDEAAAAAAHELAKGSYAQHRPPLWQRALTWLLDRLSRLLDSAVEATPGGLWGLLALAGVVGALLLAIRWRAGAMHGRARAEAPLFAERARTAAQYRAAADRAAAAGDFTRAVRDRFRAVIRDLEERGLLDERPGRTADEAAAAGGRALPGCASALVAGSRAFDEVVYGGRPADAATDARMRALDEGVRTTRAPVGAVGAVLP